MLALNAYDPATTSELASSAAQIVSEINDNEQKIDNLSGDISTIDTKIDNLSGDVAVIDTKIDGVSADLGNLDISASLVAYDVARESSATANKDEIISHGNLYWAASATVDEVSAGCILAIDDRFTFSGDSVYSYVTGQSAGAISATLDPSDLFNTVIDTLTFEEIMERLLAMSTGRITRDASGKVHTFYKQDNATALFTLTSAPASRTRS